MKTMFVDSIVLCLLYLFVLSVLLGLARLCAAPIPPPRVRPLPNMDGSWSLYWSGCEWHTVMLPCGAYMAGRSDLRHFYEGTWTRTKNSLVIKEQAVYPDGSRGSMASYEFLMRSCWRLSVDGQSLRIVKVR